MYLYPPVLLERGICPQQESPPFSTPTLNMSDKSKSEDSGYWIVGKSIALGAISLAAAYKILTTPFTLDVKFGDLMSLLLALFSVGLSAAFYFKATESSNTFYDNTYKFTKDIAELLARIESGFGERLRHLDESYASMRDQYQGAQSKDDAIDETVTEIKEEETQLLKLEEQKKELIEQLTARAHMQDEEKRSFVATLDAKEAELVQARRELRGLKRRLQVERAPDLPLDDSTRLEAMVSSYIQSDVIRKIGRPVRIGTMNFAALRNRFESISHSLPNAFLRDMESLGWADARDRLTASGMAQFRRIAKRMILQPDLPIDDDEVW